MPSFRAVLNVFDMHVELRFATSQDVKAGADLELCAAPGTATLFWTG